MKIIPRLAPLVLFFFAACCASAQSAASPVSKNLIFEGNFAEHDGRIPAGWYPGGFAGGDHGNKTMVIEDPDGNYVALIIANPATAHYTLALKEQISLRPTWRALLCSVDIRVFNYEQGKENYYKPRMHLSFIDETGTEISSTGVSLATRFGDAWQTAERQVPIPTGAVAAKLWLGTFGATGQLEFRNAYVAPVE